MAADGTETSTAAYWWLRHPVTDASTYNYTVNNGGA
jgi:hypothetical protein